MNAGTTQLWICWCHGDDHDRRAVESDMTKHAQRRDLRER